MLEHLQSHLKGKVIILGIGNTMRSDDGAGSILASRIQGKAPLIVFNAGTTPENYLEKIIKERPDTIVVIDAADFGGNPGEFELLEAKDIKTVNLFSTHNASISLTINYLQNNLEADIIILIIQPKSIILGDKISSEIEDTLNKLENWFSRLANNVKC
jgi:hydrogenase 3 maturation protease